MSFHASQVNRGNLPKQCHICHVTLYAQAPCTQSPPLLPASSKSCAFLFLFLFPSFLLTSSPLYRYRGPPSRWQTARGVITLLFTTLVRFFFLFFSIADRPFTPTCTRPPTPSSRVAFTASPLPCRLRHASRRVALAAPRLTRHASPLSCRPLATRLPFATHRVAPPSRAPLVASRLRHMPPLSRRVAPSSHVPLVASRRAFVTRSPCRVALRLRHAPPFSRRVAPSSRARLVALRLRHAPPCRVASRLRHAPTCRVAPPSHIPLVTSRRVFVTRPPCRVASLSRVAPSPRRAVCWMCGENRGEVSATGG